MTNNRPAIPPFRHGNTTLRMHGKFVALEAVFRIDGSNISLMNLIKSNAHGIGTLITGFEFLAS